MAYIYKTYSSGGTNNQKKFTASVWVKRCATGVQHEIASAYKASNGFQTDLLKFNSDDTLRFYSHSDSAQGATSFITNAKFRDTNAWYHIVLNVDTTQSTQSERFKMWVNGEQITSWSTSTYPAQNNSFIWGMPTDAVHQIGALNGSNTFNGLMSHFHYVQNANHAPTVFGETDSTTGEWKIIVEPTGITYSDQSFWFFKNDNLATDRSGNGNNWSTNGTLTKTEDNPSNVFATLNPLDNYYLGGTFAMGNNRVTTVQNRETFTTSTLGMNSGKWYFETYASSSSYDDRIGISAVPSTSNTYHLGSGAYAYGYSQSDGNIYNNNSGSSYGNNWSSTDGKYIGCYLDLDNNKIYFNIDGVVQNSGTGFSITPASSTSSGFYHFAVGEKHSSYYSLFDTNFGNGSFGSTQLTGTTYSDNNNQGIFKYNPSGTFDGTTKHFLALSTKGLNL